jgi:hypothetical protein
VVEAARLFRVTPSSTTSLSLEAMRYRFASVYDPLLAVSISKIDPLPHQVEAVYLDGFLAGRKKLQEEMNEGRLF